MLKTTQKNDGIAYSHHSTSHQIDFDNVQITTQEKNYWRRLLIEGLEIKRLAAEQRANLQLGYEKHECWQFSINCKPRCHGQHFFVEIVMRMEIQMQIYIVKKLPFA